MRYYSCFSNIRPSVFRRVKFAYENLNPPEFSSVWSTEFVSEIAPHHLMAIRQILHWLARWNIGQWCPEDKDLIRALPGFGLVKYKGVSDKSDIIPVSDRSKIVSYLDKESERYRDGRFLKHIDQMIDDCLLVISFQLGLRPLQIAMLSENEVAIFDPSTAHISVTLIKQRGQKVGRTVRRKIQPSWSPILAAYAAARGGGGEKFFDLKPADCSRRISKLSHAITGAAYSPNMYRHTSAQRLVDHGASREAVSDFLGHTDTTSANVYFEASSIQNDLVNAALGNSSIYQSVASAQRGDMISVAALLKLAPDHQVAGVPHGIPVSGIGACNAGQSLCSRNPVLACYTCHKFLPVSDASVHFQVMSDLRSVVSSFDQPERIDRVSPAMMQLRATLEAVGQVIVAAESAQND